VPLLLLSPLPSYLHSLSSSFATLGEITLKQLTKLLVQNELEDFDPVKEAFKA
jgi:hypothetical protein